MNDLLESYINGNISYVCQRLVNEPYGFSELFEAYIDTYEPSIEDIKRFVRLLTNCP